MLVSLHLILMKCIFKVREIKIKRSERTRNRTLLPLRRFGLDPSYSPTAFLIRMQRFMKFYIQCCRKASIALNDQLAILSMPLAFMYFKTMRDEMQ